MNIFVGNLSFLATENDVKGVFEAFGTVTLVSIKKKSGKNSRGFGFVVMPDDLQAEAAITGLQDKELMGRPLSVSLQRPKAVKPKKDYKEIKRLRLDSKKETPIIDEEVPTIPKKKSSPKTSKKPEDGVNPLKKNREDVKSAQPTGAQSWEKRKGRGTAKPWKKKPGGVNKKFRHAR